MLLDSLILTAIDKKLGTQPTEFNIQIFLQILQITTRPLGYPIYKDGINEQFYLLKLTSRLNQAKSLNYNYRAAGSLLDSLAQLRFCVCYFQSTLDEQKIDMELVSLLEAAIDNRLYTSAEEQCAEKSLFRMLINCSQEIMKLCSEYERKLQFPDLQQQIGARIKFIKDIHEKEAPENAQDSFTIKIFAAAIQATQEHSLFNELKKNHQALLEKYLLKHSQGIEVIPARIGTSPYPPCAEDSEKSELADNTEVAENSSKLSY
ncbi:hypothetical protein ACD661_08785 [Legionella lytica]|uniref:Uncharacterized protein n=1 Tax=Legionella lytica TaxID=96232 RepID=A0ABW8D9W6_9GAMM